MKLPRALSNRGGMVWLLMIWVLGIGLVSSQAGSTHPYFRRPMPIPQIETNFVSELYHVDLSNIHLAPYPEKAGDLSIYNGLFDARAAAILRAGVAINNGISLFPSDNTDRDLLQQIHYDVEGVPDFYTVTSKCLSAMVYADYFPNTPFKGLRDLVSMAILQAKPGWCGTFGPGVDGTFDLISGATEGNYDMTEMHLLHLAYSYFDELTPGAQEWLINQLIAQGVIHRPNEDDFHIAGGTPDDWTRAGYVSPLGVHKTIDETENHILAIQTAKYLCNQLLYQRDHLITHDNRRNGSDKRPNCTDLILSLLYNIMRDDFSEYNAKPYQEESRWALLNLCTYAYDDEVRLAARMVLDYISAHVAVSSCDLRRLVPFRRRNEDPRNRTLRPAFPGVMSVGLADEGIGADPLVAYFALQAGNTRTFELPDQELVPPDNQFPVRPWSWAIAASGRELTMEVLSSYRLPPSIHDLFVNDQHRRFFQRLRRIPRVEAGGNRNCDNMEIYAGSPSYLITAGGQPATWAIDPTVGGVDPTPSKNIQQIGVALTTSFMPAGLSAGFNPDDAAGLIQFGSASAGFDPIDVENYGVAPDFACGYSVYLPDWVQKSAQPISRFSFVDRGGGTNAPGFYLAIYQEDNGFALLEAYDTWLHPGLSFEQFKENVLARNFNLQLQSNVEADYTTQNGSHLHFVIWNNGERDNTRRGTRVLHVDYGSADPNDSYGDPGNNTDHFLNGTVLNSPADAVVEITNPFLRTQITLDMSDKWHPKRISETGEVQQAGSNHEVWIDFAWTGPTEGDFYHPFNTLGAAIAAVADGGVIKIMPGTTSETPSIQGPKRFRMTAPIGGVRLGVQ